MGVNEALVDATPPFPANFCFSGLCWGGGGGEWAERDWTGNPGLWRRGLQQSLSPSGPLHLPFSTVCCILSKAVAKAASGAPRQRLHPAPGLLPLSMAGYLSESDFVMVEEGFSTRDLLEELTLGASQATTVRVKGWEWGVAGFLVLSSGRESSHWGT